MGVSYFIGVPYPFSIFRVFVSSFKIHIHIETGEFIAFSTLWTTNTHFTSITILPLLPSPKQKQPSHWSSPSFLFSCLPYSTLRITPQTSPTLSSLLLPPQPSCHARTHPSPFPRSNSSSRPTFSASPTTSPSPTPSPDLDPALAPIQLPAPVLQQVPTSPPPPAQHRGGDHADRFPPSRVRSCSTRRCNPHQPHLAPPTVLAAHLQVCQPVTTPAIKHFLTPSLLLARCTAKLPANKGGFF